MAAPRMAAPSEATAQTHHIHTRRVSGAFLIEAAYMTRPLSVKSLHLPPRMAPGVGIVAAFTSKSSYNPIIKFKLIIQ
jgi:hypothetical protein